MVQRQSRRQVVGTMAGLGATTIAGCGEQETTEPAGTAEGDDDSNQAYTVPTVTSNPNDVQWNVFYAQKIGAWPAYGFTFEKPLWGGAFPNSVDQTDLPDYTPQLAEGYELDGATLRLSLRGNRTWHDGDPVRAEDLLVQYRLEKFLGQRSGNLWESVAAPDETTLEFTLPSAETNVDVVVPQLLTGYVRTKRDSKYGEWAEAARDATTEDERTSVKQEMVKTKIEDPLGFGPFQFESASDTRMVLTQFGDHPYADRFEFDRVEIQSIPQNQKKWQSINQGLLDGVPFASMPASQEESVPEYMLRLAYTSTTGDCLKYNVEEPPFDTRTGRQAVAYLINRKQNASNAKDFISVPEYPTGLSKRQREAHLGDDLEGFRRYGYDESNTERAAAKFREAGYEKRDGSWVDAESGEPLQVDITTPSAGTWPLNARTASNTFSEFGIESNTIVKDKAAFGESVSQGDYQMTVHNWGARGVGGDHPYNFFSQEFGQDRCGPQNYDPTSVDVPYPVGDPDGDVETVDVTERFASLAKATDDERSASLIRELAWIYNQSLPRLPLLNGVSRVWLNTRDWSVPEDDPKWLRTNPAVDAVRNGKINPKS